jgi:hypothetical protein
VRIGIWDLLQRTSLRDLASPRGMADLSAITSTSTSTGPHDN